MFTDFFIQNFRVFDNEGTTVPLRPITILTGCNNSGKSSIVKALCLLKDFCQQLETDFKDGKKLHFERYKMDFHKTPNNVLGGFDLVRHHATKEEIEKKGTTGNSEEPGNKPISFDVIVESSWLLQDVILHLEFGSLDWDDLNNGYLQAYAIKTLDGKVIYQTERNGKTSMDFSIVKNQFLYFLYGQYAFSTWQSEISYRDATGSYPAGEDKVAKLFDDSNKKIIEKSGPNAVIYLFEWQVSHCHRTWQDGSEGAGAAIMKNVPEYSFAINSPTLGVFCYFPCLQLFKNFKKNEIRQEVNKRLESQNEPVSSLNRKIINLFLDSFETSDSESLHEYINQNENIRFFVDSDIHGLGRHGFTFPLSFWRMDGFSFNLFDESSLPKTANWSVILYAMDLINKATTNTPKSLVDYDEINNCWYYYAENSIDDFLRRIIEEIFVNMIPGTLAYSPTTIVQPKRLYSLEENDDFARTLKRYFDAKRLFEEEGNTSSGYLMAGSREEDKSYKPCMFIDKWMKHLGIANHVDIKTHADGYGVTIRLYEDDKDVVGMSLTDKGFGVLQLFAVLLKIEIAILEMQTNKKLYYYCTTGLNTDIVKYLRTHNQLHPATVALEEPECHLHPSLQSKFADMIVDAYKQYGVHFIIESHSEYFIRKLQLLVSQKEIMNDDISLLYINPASRPSYIPVITDIGLEEDGTLKNEFGPGFFDESLRLGNELFKNKVDDDNKMKNDEDQA